MMDVGIIRKDSEEINETFKNFTCNYCRLKGHIKKNCKKLLIDWRSVVLTFKDGYRFEEGDSVIVDCASVIKFGEILDDSEIFESVEPIVCYVGLPDC